MNAKYSGILAVTRRVELLAVDTERSSSAGRVRWAKKRRALQWHNSRLSRVMKMMDCPSADQGTRPKRGEGSEVIGSDTPERTCCGFRGLVGPFGVLEASVRAFRRVALQGRSMWRSQSTQGRPSNVYNSCMRVRTKGGYREAGIIGWLTLLLLSLGRGRVRKHLDRLWTGRLDLWTTRDTRRGRVVISCSSFWMSRSWRSGSEFYLACIHPASHCKEWKSLNRGNIKHPTSRGNDRSWL